MFEPKIYPITRLGSPKVTSPKSKPCLEWVRGGRDAVAHLELQQQTAFSSNGNPTRAPSSNSPWQRWPERIEAHMFEEISQRAVNILSIRYFSLPFVDCAFDSNFLGFLLISYSN